MHRRIDTDALLSNLLVYLLLCGYVASIYTAVLTSSMSLGLVAAQDARVIFSPPWWVNIIVVILVAFTLLPVRRWLLTRVHVLIYGEHDDPYTLIALVNRQLQGMLSPHMTLPTVTQTIATKLKLPYVAVQAPDFRPALLIEFGVRPESSDMATIPVLYIDRSMGVLCVGARQPREKLSRADATLLGDLARQIGIALHAAQLTADLQESRERIVIAREEERRRIRNDLHDGLAPTLSSLQLQLGSLRRMVQENPAQAESLVDEMRADLRSATAAIRDLVYNLRPPMLDELGLVGALRSLRFPDSSIRFEFVAPQPMPKLPAALEVAVYRIASEAIHNVIRHSQAKQCVVAIELNEGHLTLSVTDDGTSLPHGHHVGVGLHSMRERVAELRGTLAVQSCESGGTCLVAQFPIAH